MFSVYHDKNKKRVDLYVNYRQEEGNGLSGIATSFNGIVDMLQSSQLSEHGELFIVDGQGKIQVHPNPDVAGKLTLSELYSDRVSQTLLVAQNYNQVDSTSVANSYLVSSYIPSMGWFVVGQLERSFNP